MLVIQRRLVSGWGSRLAWVAVLVVFLASRLVFLDRDVPPWDLAMYQPIDEAAYTIPAFNLHHYGTWTHQDAAWVPLEGSPMNVTQSLATAATLVLGWDYWGFRLSSVLFALLAFVAMVALVRRLAASARDDGAPFPIGRVAVLGGAVVLLLVDFGFLMSARVVEATIPRVAVLAVLLYLVSRGAFLGERHDLRHSVGLGVLAGLGATFGYIYSAFLIPGVALAIGLWGWQRGWRFAGRQVALALLGSGLAVAFYFVAVYGVYGDDPIAWYQRWVAGSQEAGRASGLDLRSLWDLTLGNSLRLDRPLMAAALAGLPIFAWWAARRRDRLGLTVLAMLVAFAAQTVVQSDYPQRKMLIILPLILPLVAGGALRIGEFRQWTTANPARRRIWMLWIGWVIVVAIVTLALSLPHAILEWSFLHRRLGIPAASALIYSGPGGIAVVIGAVTGTLAVVAAALAWARPRIFRLAALTLAAAMLGPVLLIDLRYVYASPTFEYRDAMIDLGTMADGRVTAGAGYAMQLYNTTRPVLESYVFGMSQAEYEGALVRYFREGSGTYLLGYADAAALEQRAALGFRLLKTYPIELPKGHVMGVFVYDPRAN